MRREITVDALLTALRERETRLPVSLAAFIALEVTEGLEDAPMAVSGAGVLLSADGEIYLDRGATVSEREAADAVRDLLATLLVTAGPGVPTMLLDIVEGSGATGDLRSLAALRDALEASLVPLNRAASRRVLSRLVREGEVVSPSQPSLGHDEGASLVDDELDDLLGAAEQHARADGRRSYQGRAREGHSHQGSSQDGSSPPARRRGRQGARVVGDGEPLRDAASSAHPAERSWEAQVSTAKSAPGSRAGRDAALARPAVALDGGDGHLGMTTLSGAPPPGRGYTYFVGFIALAVGLVGLVAWRRPDVIERLTGAAPLHAPAAAPTPQVVVRRPDTGRVRVLAPPGAQILLLRGAAPVVVPELPRGVPHEFVAVAEGAAPSRAVVPADAVYEAAGDRPPRYELAIQTGEHLEAGAALELGPSKLPDGEARPPSASGLGEVRVLTSPPGAKVYQLIGFGPHAELEDVRRDRAITLAVYVPGHGLVFETVEPAHFAADSDGSYVATVRALVP